MARATIAARPNKNRPILRGPDNELSGFRIDPVQKQAFDKSRSFIGPDFNQNR
jgi:hypothetical protein